MIRKRKNVDPERLKRAKRRTPAEWPRNVALEDIIGFVGMLEANYALCFPKRGARSRIPGVNAANRYILSSSSWRALGEVSRRERKEGGSVTTVRSSAEQRALVDEILLARGAELLRDDVAASTRSAAVLGSGDAALLRALHHPFIAADVKRALRDELRRRDRARKTGSIDASRRRMSRPSGQVSSATRKARQSDEVTSAGRTGARMGPKAPA
jgi:hypothetical protein